MAVIGVLTIAAVCTTLICLIAPAGLCSGHDVVPGEALAVRAAFDQHRRRTGSYPTTATEALSALAVVYDANRISVVEVQPRVFQIEVKRGWRRVRVTMESDELERRYAHGSFGDMRTHSCPTTE
jgi:hypothetical protein